MNERRVRKILAEVKPLAAEYYRLTGKPLGVTGEIAEYAAAKALGLKLAVARTAGYDALRGRVRVQIKGRALAPGNNRSHKLGRIKRDADCDVVMLVVLDKGTLDLREIWQARYDTVVKRLNHPGSKGRERGELMIGDFKRLKNARQVWPLPRKKTK